MRSPDRPLQALRVRVAELGPIPWIALASALLPTAGLLVVLAHLPELATAWPPGVPGAACAVAAVAACTGAVLLPPGIGAFAAGYVFGPVLGPLLAAVAIGVGAVFGQVIVWPRLGRDICEFLRPRPRVVAVRRFCGGPANVGAWRVAVLRWAARVPFSVTNLLLSLAGVPWQRTWIGSTMAAVPPAWLAGAIGAAWRQWRERSVPPSGPGLANLLLAAAVVAVTLLMSRRAFRNATAAR